MSTEPRTVTWTIDRAQGSISLSSSSVYVDNSTKSKTVTVARPGNGSIVASSSDTKVATVSVSGTTITITGKGTGNATVTIYAAQGTNYTKSDEKTISVSSSVTSSELADGYTQLEYIENARVKTFQVSTYYKYNFYASKIVADVQVLGYTSGNEYLFYTKESALSHNDTKLNYAVTLYLKSASTIGYRIGVSPATATISNFIGKRQTIEIDKPNGRLVIGSNVISIDKISSSLTMGNYTNIGLSTTVSSNYDANTRWYGVKIYTSGTLASNLVPCRQNSTGKLGFYDTIKAAFRYSTTQTGITAGPEV